MRGQTPSSSPARIRRSARTSRASMAPRICSRGCSAPPGRIVWPRNRSATRSAKPAAVTGGSEPPSSISWAIRAEAASPVWPFQAPPPQSASSTRASASADAEASAMGVNSLPSGSSAACSAWVSATALSMLAGSTSSRSVSTRRRRLVSPSHPAGRGPRNPRRSRVRSAPGQASVSATSGCFRVASRVEGEKPSATASVTSPTRVPTGSSASGLPPELSTAIRHLASRADTRCANAGSGVTNAAVLPEVSSASLSSTAMAAAASSSCRASTTANPARPSEITSVSVAAPSAASALIWTNQSLVASAGRSASLTIRRRARPRAASRAVSNVGQERTCARETPAVNSRRFIAPCG